MKVSVRPGRGFFQTLARWWWLELLLLIALPCAFAALAVVKHQKRAASYESTALIEIAPPAGVTGPEALKIELNTQCAILRSDPCLKRVVEDLDLGRMGNVADSAAAVAKLKPMVGAHPVDGTRLLRVTARAKNPATARDLAAGLASAYLQVRSEHAADAHQRLVNEIKRQILIQEDTVEQHRKLLYQIARARGMIFGGGLADVRDSSQTTVERLAAREPEYRVRKAGLEGRIKALEEDDSNALLAEAAAATPPNQTPAILFRELKGKLDELKQLGDPEPGSEAARALENRIAELRDALRREFDVALGMLRGQLAAVNAEWELVRSQLASARDDLVNESAGNAEYRDARRNYDRETALLQVLRQKWSEVEIAVKLEPPPAVVREEPVTATRPVNHHPRREVAGAAFVGFVLAFIGMIPLALLLEGFSANRRLKKAAAAPEPAGA